MSFGQPPSGGSLPPITRGFGPPPGPAPPNEKLAKASQVLASVGLLASSFSIACVAGWMGLLLGAAAVVCGTVALSLQWRSPARYGGRVSAWLGVGLGVKAILLCAALTFLGSWMRLGLYGYVPLDDLW
jgi:hypothetical protein